MKDFSKGLALSSFALGSAYVLSTTNLKDGALISFWIFAFFFAAAFCRWN